MRPTLTPLFMIIIFIGTFLAAVGTGTVNLDFKEVYHLITFQPHLLPEWKKVILFQLRTPRFFLGILVGGALSVSGASLQNLFHNPLAAPGLLGISPSAAFGAVLCLFFGLSSTFSWILPLFAFVSSIVILLILYMFAYEKGNLSSFRLILSGVALSSLFSALISFLLSISLQNQFDLGKQIAFWLLGTLSHASWFQCLLLMPLIALGLILIYPLHREMDALALSEVHAQAIGISVQKTYLQILLGLALLIGSSVAVSGMIGFVGLIIPHCVRLWKGAQTKPLFLWSFFIGGLFLVWMDMISRVVIAPQEIKLGVLTALIGAPTFLVLLMRGTKKGEGSACM